MTKKKQLQETISDLEAGIKSPATPEMFKTKMKQELEKTKKALVELEEEEKKKQSAKKPKAEPKPKTKKPQSKKPEPKPAPKPTKGGKRENPIEKAKRLARERRKAQGISASKDDIEKDSKRPALPIGKRKSADGNTYYEYRENRIDRKQPPKRYPKLEDGGDVNQPVPDTDFNPQGAGMFANGGQTDSLIKELHRLQRELNSPRLRTYTEGDNSEEAKNREKERQVKLDRFNEVLMLLRERDEKKFAKGGVLNHGFMKGDTILEVYKGHAIIENNNDGVIQIINPEVGTRFIVDLDDSKMSGKRTSSGMSKEEQMKAAMLHIDNSKPIDMGMMDGNNDASFAFGGRLKSAIMRDRAYKSEEPHEQAYDRKSLPSNPKYKYEHGGEMHRSEGQMSAFEDGGIMINLQDGGLDADPRFDINSPEFKKGGKLESRYNYLSARDIESITTWNGVNIDGDKILDGIYIKKGVKL